MTSLTTTPRLFVIDPGFQPCLAPKPIFILYGSLDFVLLILSNVGMNPDPALTMLSQSPSLSPVSPPVNRRLLILNSEVKSKWEESMSPSPTIINHPRRVFPIPPPQKFLPVLKEKKRGGDINSKTSL